VGSVAPWGEQAVTFSSALASPPNRQMVAEAGHVYDSGHSIARPIHRHVSNAPPHVANSHLIGRVSLLLPPSTKSERGFSQSTRKMSYWHCLVTMNAV
jgi:hypothetical protein